MQGDNLREMSKHIFWESKENIIYMSSESDKGQINVSPQWLYSCILQAI